MKDLLLCTVHGGCGFPLGGGWWGLAGDVGRGGEEEGERKGGGQAEEVRERRKPEGQGGWRGSQDRGREVLIGSFSGGQCGHGPGSSSGRPGPSVLPASAQCGQEGQSPERGSRQLLHAVGHPRLP